ncbi:MAG: hypothetical protein NT123_06400 [Proteobacteria bacterium]|nr:hypothetical protein [Pseudomonadota bacterium]
MKKPASRWKAAAIHLSASAIVAAVVVWAMLRIWYPSPYFEALGGRRLIELIVGVDVVLGPLITLVVFDTRKKSLKFDLAAVAVLQMAALAYGVHVAFQARPAYLLFVKDRFEIVTANQLEPEQLAKVKRPEFKTVPFSGPVAAAAELPTDPKELELLTMLAISTGVDVQLFPQYFVPYAEQKKLVLSMGKPPQLVGAELPQFKPVLEKALADAGLRSPDVLILPLYIKQRDLAVIVSAESANVVGVVSAD